MMVYSRWVDRSVGALLCTVDLDKVNGSMRPNQPEDSLQGDEGHVAPLADGLAPAKSAVHRLEQRAAPSVLPDVEGDHTRWLVGRANRKG